MADLAFPARHQPNVRRQALARTVAFDHERGVYIVPFPLQPRPSGNLIEQSRTRARYQAQRDAPEAPVRWAPTRLERAFMRLANAVRRLVGRAL
jgi:hypothetical protein